MGYLEQEERQYHDHTPKGKIDVKAPSPGDVCSEGPADQWAEHRRDAKYGTKETLVCGPLMQRDGIDNDDDLR